MVWNHENWLSPLNDINQRSWKPLSIIISKVTQMIQTNIVNQWPASKLPPRWVYRTKKHSYHPNNFFEWLAHTLIAKTFGLHFVKNNSPIPIIRNKSQYIRIKYIMFLYFICPKMAYIIVKKEQVLILWYTKYFLFLQRCVSL